VSLACRKAKDLGYPHELWTTRLLARHAREHWRRARPALRGRRPRPSRRPKRWPGLSPDESRFQAKLEEARQQLRNLVIIGLRPELPGVGAQDRRLDANSGQSALPAG
jgi:hypothetical protein